MNQEIEIEFKNLLTGTEFARLCKTYRVLPTNFTTQHNEYFDTQDFLLKRNKIALRIRKKDGSDVLTLKQPVEVGLLETHQPLEPEEVEILIKEGRLPEGDVATVLSEAISEMGTLIHLGRLTTKRAEIKSDGGVLVFDHSYYLGTEDFELEFEASDYQAGKTAFGQLLEENQIPIRSTKNKIVRFYERQLDMERGHLND